MPKQLAVLFFLLLLALACASPAAAQSTTAAATILPWTRENVVMINASYVPIVCLRSSDTIQPRRPCYKTRYPGRVGTNAEFLSFSSKYFYVCDVAANTVSLYQCGDERVLGDVAGTDCSSKSKKSSESKKKKELV